MQNRFFVSVLLGAVQFYFGLSFHDWLVLRPLEDSLIMKEINLLAFLSIVNSDNKVNAA